MPVVLSPNQSQIQTVLRSALLAMLPPGVDVIEGQDNRVPEPEEQDFVVMTAFHRLRLRTNVDTYLDAAYSGSLSAGVMTVSHVLIGSVKEGATLFGTGVNTGTVIGAQASGTPGGIGTYGVSGTQTLASLLLASGSVSIEQGTEVTFQLDVHGPNSADNVETISTLFRDYYGVREFHEASISIGVTPGLIVPLYADDPRQAPFVNDQDQVEYRWSLDAHVQADQAVSNVPQQFFDVVDVALIPVEQTYPP